MPRSAPVEGHAFEALGTNCSLFAVGLSRSRLLDGELWVNQVVIFPENGTIEVRALTGDGEEIGLPEAWESLDDATVITDDSFYEDEPPPKNWAVPSPPET